MPPHALTLDAFAQRLGSTEDVPILVLRLPQLERVAWTRGRAVARRLERRALRAFAQGARRVLRADDLLAHEPASDTFVAALAAKVRLPRADRADPGARAAIARIGAVLETSLGLTVETGWATWDGERDARALPALLQRALAQGAHERERFAFFSAVGHELRTPLASIRGYLETVLEETIEPQLRRRFTAVAYRESLRLSRLIDGMFEISMLDLRPSAGAAARASLSSVLDAVRDATLNAAHLRGVHVEIVPCADLTAAIDADRLVLAVVNLVENAVKHGRAGGHVRVVSERIGNDVGVTVDDDGPGICVEERERLFALGVRGRTSAAGNGVGLALVRLLVERAGGRVEVGPSPLGGARFVVVLRSTPADAELPAAADSMIEIA